MVRAKIAIIAILTIIYLSGTSCEQFGVSSTSPWWTHFTYQLFHGNITHLLCNIYALWLCLDKKRFQTKIILPVYLITVAASFIGQSAIPVVGISGAIFSILGINLALTPTKPNILYMTIILSVGFIMPQISGITHLTNFIIGFISSAVYRNLKRFKNDYR